MITATIDDFEKGECTVESFCDMKQAFNYIDHNLIIEKLYYYGIYSNPVQPLKSYLTHRKQFIYLNSMISNLVSVNNGVPQGAKYFPTSTLTYADDTFFTTRKDIQNVLSKVDDTLDRASE